jgi:hypothetical protein
MEDCEILLLGDSHFFIMTGEKEFMIDKPDIIDNNRYPNQKIMQNSEYRYVYYFYLAGTAAAGFRPNHSSKTGAFTMAYEYIKPLKDTVKLVFKFGQVDMDRVYLYKCVDTNKKLDLDTFIDDTIAKYISGLLEFKKLNKNIYIFGINPPSTRTVRIMLSQIGQQDKFNEYKTLPYDFLLESRTDDFRLFNEKLKAQCEKYNFTYLDCWDRLVDDHQSVTRVLKFLYYRPDSDDNHIYIKNDPSWYDYFWGKIHETLQITQIKYKDQVVLNSENTNIINKNNASIKLHKYPWMVYSRKGK